MSRKSSECVLVLANNPNVDWNIKDVNGLTPVYIALREGSVENFRLLMSKTGIDFQVKTNFEESLAFAAVDGGKVECVRLLLEMNCLDWNEVNCTGDTPVIKAMRENKIKIVKLLIQSPHVDGNVRDIFGQSLYALAKSDTARDILLSQRHVSIDQGSNIPLYVRYQGLRYRFLRTNPGGVFKIDTFIGPFIKENRIKAISKRTIDKIKTFEDFLQELEKGLLISPEKGKLHLFIKIVESVKNNQLTPVCCNPVTPMCLK